MMHPTLRRGTLLVLSGTLAVVSSACSNTNSAIPLNQPAKAETPAASPAAPTRVKVSQSPKPTKPATDYYSEAVDTGEGALNISQTAVSREDWSLAASRWQEAVSLLKAVPSSSNQYANSQKKLSQYEYFLADAKLRAAQPPSKSKYCSGDTTPEFFSVPIKDHMDRTPVVEVTFNDFQKFDMLFDTGASHSLITRSMAAGLRSVPVGAQQSQIADGSFVILPVVKVKSMEMDGRVMSNLSVAVAPPAMKTGLLGQDFYKGYEVKITDTAIEFRRSKGVTKATQSQKACTVFHDTNPQFFQVPIKTRNNGIPVVEVTFNEKYKFPMLFDTGASHTLLTESMANKMKLKPIGRVAVEIANGSVVTLPVAVVKSNRISDRIKRDVLVSVASASDTGLLGQDFFEGYDVTIKDKVIEFRRREGAQ